MSIQFAMAHIHTADPSSRRRTTAATRRRPRNYAVTSRTRSIMFRLPHELLRDLRERVPKGQLTSVTIQALQAWLTRPQRYDAAKPRPDRQRYAPLLPGMEAAFPSPRHRRGQRISAGSGHK